jgi:hypothetical protein
MCFGFSPGNWAELKSALLNHPQNNPVTSQASNPFGQKFDHRAARPQSEIHHRLSKPLRGERVRARGPVEVRHYSNEARRLYNSSADSYMSISN